MKVQNRLIEIQERFRIIFIQQSDTFLCQKLLGWFRDSTLIMEEKMTLLRTRPSSKTEIGAILNILESNFNTSLTPRRDQEWAELTLNTDEQRNTKISKTKEPILAMIY